MVTRRDFLRLGALFVPVAAAPTVAYSFLWAKPEPKLMPPVRLTNNRTITLNGMVFPAASVVLYLDDRRIGPVSDVSIECAWRDVT